MHCCSYKKCKIVDIHIRDWGVDLQKDQKIAKIGLKNQIIYFSLPSLPGQTNYSAQTGNPRLSGREYSPSPQLLPQPQQFPHSVTELCPCMIVQAQVRQSYVGGWGTVYSIGNSINVSCVIVQAQVRQSYVRGWGTVYTKVFYIHWQTPSSVSPVT